MSARASIRLVMTSLVVLTVSGVTARADWVASGVFQYMDREYDINGFTGIQVPRPIREADVEVVDSALAASKAVIATGVTGQDGSFSIFVPDAKVRTVYVRVVTDSQYTANLAIDVRNATASQAQRYASTSANYAGHAPTVNLNVGTLVAAIGQGGEAFNLYDQMLRGMDYLAFLNGSRPTASLATVWAINNGVNDSTYDIGSRLINMRATGGYDDTVVLHEMGHYAVYNFSASSSTFGFHTFALCDIDVRLAFDEGFATWWGNSVLRHLGMPQCNVYARTNGAPGTGNLVRSADLETDDQYLCQGGAGEVNVFSLIWDITDGPSTTDTTPGADEPHDVLAMPDSSVWEVMTGFMPGATTRSLEDFWNGWFLPPALNGSKIQMIALAEPMGIEYFQDLFEGNDNAPQAWGVAVNAPPAGASFFRDPDGDGAGASDVDYFSFPVVGAQQYTIETKNLFGGANTNLRLYGPDGVTLLAINDDRASGDPSSRIVWTPSAGGTLHAQITQVSASAVFGSYGFQVSAAGLDQDSDGWDSTADCNDFDSGIFPGAIETCDGLDQDCDGTMDEGFDQDVDGYTVCEGDCNDGDPAINPAINEVPGNAVDENCDGLILRLLETGRASPRVYIPL